MNEDTVATQSLARTPSEILGVTVDAPLTLVERIYWKRAHVLMEADRRGEPGARARLEELNAAQAQIREALPANRIVAVPAVESGTHRGAALAVFGASLLCAGIAAAVGGPIAGGAVFAGGAAAALVLSMRAAPTERGADEAQRDALAVLHLAPGAAPDEIQIAYDTLRDSALAEGSDRDPAVLDRLGRLQSAYHSALPSGGAAYRSS